jgi:hypothetical protein
MVVSVHIAQEFVDASLVGSGIGDADAGIAGCQCYGCCRRHAQYCLLDHFFLF